MKIELEPIGEIQNDKKHSCNPDEIKKVQSKIIVNEKYRVGLTGIENCENIDVVFYMHKNNEVILEGTNRWGDYCGVFASRWPSRPNHIGITRCKIIAVNYDNCEIIVDGLDALDGSILLDIKCGDKKK